MLNLYIKTKFEYKKIWFSYLGELYPCQSNGTIVRFSLGDFLAVFSSYSLLFLGHLDQAMKKSR